MDVDPQFYERADAHIHLSNDQALQIDAGKVSASMMFATARFNAWLSARGFDSGAEMKAARNETLDYFCDQYRSALELHFDEYVKNFSNYMRK